MTARDSYHYATLSHRNLRRQAATRAKQVGHLHKSPKIQCKRRSKKVSSYIAHYPILRIAQSALHFTSLADLFNQTRSQLLCEASRHMLQLIREGCSYTHPPLSIAGNSFTQLSELEQCRVETTCPRF